MLLASADKKKGMKEGKDIERENSQSKWKIWTKQKGKDAVAESENLCLSSQKFIFLVFITNFQKYCNLSPPSQRYGNFISFFYV